MKVIGKLTRRRALELTRDLWLWLADDPRRTKADWPGWKQHGRMDADCPCCHYSFGLTNEIGGGVCDNCPLSTFWGVGTCEALYTAFDKWQDPGFYVDPDWGGSGYSDYQKELRRDSAKEIAEACSIELRRIRRS